MKAFMETMMSNKTPKKTGYYLEAKESEIDGKKVWIVFEQTSYNSKEDAELHVTVQQQFNKLAENIKID